MPFESLRDIRLNVRKLLAVGYEEGSVADAALYWCSIWASYILQSATSTCFKDGSDSLVE